MGPEGPKNKGALPWAGKSRSMALKAFIGHICEPFNCGIITYVPLEATCKVFDHFTIMMRNSSCILHPPYTSAS